MMKPHSSLLRSVALAAITVAATASDPLGDALAASGQSVRSETRSSSGGSSSGSSTGSTSGGTTTAGTTSSRLEVRTINGQTEVHLNGQRVYNGPADGPVTSRSRSVNGVEHTAVYAGDTLLWDSANAQGNAAIPAQPGQPTPPTPPAAPGPLTQPDLRKFQEEHEKQFEELRREQHRFIEKERGGLAPQERSTDSKRAARSSTSRRAASDSARANVEIRKVDGSTVIVYQGREFSVGPTDGPIKTKVIQNQGEDFAAAFEGDRVIWENRPGAAKHLR